MSYPTAVLALRSAIVIGCGKPRQSPTMCGWFARTVKAGSPDSPTPRPVPRPSFLSRVATCSLMGNTAGACQSAVRVLGFSSSNPNELAPLPALYLKPAHAGPLPAAAASSFLFSRLGVGSQRTPSGSNRTSTGGAASKASDKKDTLASLGHAEELRVKYPPCQTIPERIQGFEQASEILPIRARERSGDVLPKNPLRPDLANSSNVLPHETGRPFESGPRPCDREGLAGAPSDNEVWPSALLDKAPPIHLRDVPEVGDVREPLREDGRWERVDLGERQGLPPHAVAGDARRLYAAEQAQVPQSAPSRPSMTLAPQLVASSLHFPVTSRCA